MNKTALIIGITGGYGGAITEALQKHGWTINALHRNPDNAKNLVSDPSNINWIQGDAMNADDVVGAGKGCSVIIHAANPPGYKNWKGLAIPMLDNSIIAAKANNARLVFPGNVYNFGPDAGSEINEDAPQNPISRKGKIRVEMERTLKHGTDSGLKVLIVRAGDYLGPKAPGSWFQSAMVKPGKPVKKVIYPGEWDVGHAWAYLPDMAEATIMLLDKQDDLDAFAVFHFRGHALERGVEIAEVVAKVVGGNISIGSLPWPLLYIIAPFSETFREIIEMRYLWKVSVQLDNTKLKNFIGEEPHTPLHDAISNTLDGMGCLEK